jgi:3-hydroxyacyl-CoA dehydrogenase
VLHLPGESGRVLLAGAVHDFRLKGMATPYDEVVSGRLAVVLTGGETDLVDTVAEDDLLKLERQQFMAAAKDPRTIARVEAMLETGKPLRN